MEHAQRRAGMALGHLLVIPWRPWRGTLRPGAITTTAFERAVQELDATVRQAVSHLQALDLAPRRLRVSSCSSCSTPSSTPQRS